MVLNISHLSFNKYTTNVLGWLASKHHQDHSYNKACFDQHLPCFPGLPNIQLSVPSSLLTNIVFELYSSDDTFIKSYNLGDPQLIVNTLEDTDNPSIDHLYFRLNKDNTLDEGCYYLCADITGSNNTNCKLYTNQFKVTKKCMHQIIFWNKCDRGKVIYNQGYWRQCLYINGEFLPDEELETDIERSELANGCFRTDKYSIKARLALKNLIVLPNQYKALIWALGHDNVVFISSEGIPSIIVDGKVELINEPGKKKRLKKIDISWQDFYFNPQSCCYDYLADGVDGWPTSLCKAQSCPPCVLNAEVASCTQNEVVFDIETSSPYTIYHNGGVVVSGSYSATFTLSGLSLNESGHIVLINECGGVDIVAYQTKSCNISVVIGALGIQCGESNGELTLNVSGLQGAYTVSVCDAGSNELFSTTDLAAKWILNPLLVEGVYTLKINDANCSYEENFQIFNECICQYDYQFSSTNCTCTSLGEIFIDDVQVIAGSGDYDINLCDSQDNVIASAPSAPHTFTNLPAGVYTLKVFDSDCSIDKVVFINDVCECNAPTWVNYENGGLFFQDTFAQLYEVIITPILGNGLVSGYTIIDTINNPNGDDGFIGYGNKDIICGTTYKVKITAKCGIGIKDKKAESIWFTFTTEECPPCGDQDLNISINQVGSQLQVEGNQTSTGGAGLIDYSQDGINWSTISPLFNDYSNACAPYANSNSNPTNLCIIDDPLNSSNHCLILQFSNPSVIPNILTGLNNCTEIFGIRIGSIPLTLLFDADLVNASMPLVDTLHITYPKAPNTKQSFQPTVDYLAANNTGTTKTVVETFNFSSFSCCQEQSVFVRLIYQNCPVITKCVTVFTVDEYNVNDI